jgi:KaiC/GvpD/RAD55 family RecA-like ATPase
MQKTMPEELNKLEDATEILPLYVAAQLSAQDTSSKISSGIPDLDDCMDGGFREGDFTIISGIPGDGKTTLARMFTLHFAEAGIPSLWFSYEMTIRELWDSFSKMGADTGLISYVPMVPQDDYDWVIKQLDAARAKYKVKAIFIDTLGDIVRSVKKAQELNNYATYLAQLCKDLRMYAIKHEVMIFAVAHATKQTRSNTNETDNSDIANSNGIPAAATNIFHIWRDKKEENTSIVKIGKSRRDGTKKGWKFKMRFINNRFVPIDGRYTTLEEEIDL